MGQLRRPRRGAHLAVRRDLPGQRVDVHLRPRLPGRPDRADARARPGVLLLRGPLHRPGGRRPGRGGGAGPSAPTSGSSTPRGARAWSRRWPTATSGPGWSTTPASSSTVPGSPPGPGCALHVEAGPARGCSHVELKPEVCWQLPAAPRGRDVTRRPRHLGGPAVGPSPLGRGRRRSSTGGAPRTRRRSSGTEPVYRTMRTELEAMAGRKVYKRLAAYLDERTGTAGHGDPAAPPHRPPLTGCRSGRPDATAAVTGSHGAGRPRATRPAGRTRRTWRRVAAVPRISS